MSWAYFWELGTAGIRKKINPVACCCQGLQCGVNTRACRHDHTFLFALPRCWESAQLRAWALPLLVVHAAWPHLRDFLHA